MKTVVNGHVAIEPQGNVLQDKDIVSLTMNAIFGNTAQAKSTSAQFQLTAAVMMPTVAIGRFVQVRTIVMRKSAIVITMLIVFQVNPATRLTIFASNFLSFLIFYLFSVFFFFCLAFATTLAVCFANSFNLIPAHSLYVSSFRSGWNTYSVQGF